MRKPARFEQLGSVRGPYGADADARAEAELRPLWAFAVGPLLARRTRLLRVRRGRLVVGCWELHLIPSLRQAAEQAWPAVQTRLARALGLRLAGLEIVPCDPPPPEPPPRTHSGDPLRDVLERLSAKRP